jgi:NitT/TauT family transport system substrate-binding protein
VLDSYFATSRDYYRDRNGCISADLIQKPIDAMVSENLIAHTIDVAKYLSTSYLPSACPA